MTERRGSIIRFSTSDEVFASRMDHRVLVLFCLASSLILLPFSVQYGLSERYFTAAGLGLLVLAYGVLGIHIARCKRAWPFNYLLATIATLATLIPIGVLGSGAAGWLFPLILVNFYLLPRWQALLVNLLSALIAGTLLFQTMALVDLAHGVAIGLALTFFSWAFAWGIDRRQGELIDQARRDPLTGLKNRRCLYLDLQQSLRGDDDSEKMVVVFYDLNGLKRFNDAFGHLFGDRLIHKVADLLKESAAPSGEAFRFGGDEFIVIYRGLTTREATSEARRVAAAVSRDIHPGPDPLTISWGVAAVEPADRHSREVLARADAAMYANKRDTEASPGTDSDKADTG